MDTENCIPSGKACQIMKVTPITLRRWGETGRITVTRIGGRLFFDRLELEKMVVTKTRKVTVKETPSNDDTDIV